MVRKKLQKIRAGLRNCWFSATGRKKIPHHVGNLEVFPCFLIEPFCIDAFSVEPKDEWNHIYSKTMILLREHMTSWQRLVYPVEPEEIDATYATTASVLPAATSCSAVR
jgi:hypothetical protein